VHAGIHKPVHHLGFERGNIRGNNQDVLGVLVQLKGLIDAGDYIREHASLVGDEVNGLFAGQSVFGRESDQDDIIHTLCIA